MSEEKLKRTSLYDTHVKYGGKMVPFAGWEMPVQYKAGVISEHMAVRTKAGMFDVSHMGEIVCKGPDALANLNMLLTNDYAGMADGQARYSPMCNEEGGVVDDLIVYKKNDEEYLMVVNAANKDKDFNWMKAHQTGDVTFEDISDTIGQIALQGPLAKKILLKLVSGDAVPQEYYACTFDQDMCGTKVMISTTGYTGEDGVEIYMPMEKAPEIWEALMEAGKDEGLIPCGLGARDTLRLEAGMPLYGHEMDDTITPKEALLSIFVKMDKPDFIGKAAIQLPDAFMKRWIKTANEDKFTMEQIEAEYDLFAKDFRWNMIRTKLMKDQDMKFAKEDLMKEAMSMASYQFAMYGMQNVPEEHLTRYAEQLLGDRQQAERIVERVEDDLVLNWLRGTATLEKKDISLEEMRELTK